MSFGSLWQEWSPFVAWFLISVVVGAFSYWVLRSRFGLVRMAGFAAFVVACWIYALGLDDSLRHGTSLFFNLTVARWSGVFLLSLVQASVERSADAVRLSWRLRLVRALATNTLCLCLGDYVMNTFLRLMLSGSFGLHPGFWLGPSLRGKGMWAYVMGLALTPLVLSVFRRVLPQLQLHTGVDRLLDEGEALA